MIENDGCIFVWRCIIFSDKRKNEEERERENIKSNTKFDEKPLLYVNIKKIEIYIT